MALAKCNKIPPQVIRIFLHLKLFRSYLSFHRAQYVGLFMRAEHLDKGKK